MIDVLVIGEHGETDLKCPVCGGRLYAKWREPKLSTAQRIGTAPSPATVNYDRPFNLNCENSGEIGYLPEPKWFCPNPTLISRDLTDGKWPRLLFSRTGLIGVPLKNIPDDWY
jgi:hypothetical protein